MSKFESSAPLSSRARSKQNTFLRTKHFFTSHNCDPFISLPNRAGTIRGTVKHCSRRTRQVLFGAIDYAAVHDFDKICTNRRCESVWFCSGSQQLFALTAAGQRASRCAQSVYCSMRPGIYDKFSKSAKGRFLFCRQMVLRTQKSPSHRPSISHRLI